MLPVDSGIPMPPPGKRKYPWHEMKVGDSFFAPNKTSAQFAAMINAYTKRNRGKFQGRDVIENNIKGCRVWRLE